MSQTRSGTVTVTADGYGTLQTPAGTYQNVLRVHTVETLTDNFMGFPTTNQTIHRWSWYAPNEKYILMHIDSVIVQPVSGPSSTSTSMFYRKSTTTSLQPGHVAAPQFLAFPNPAQDHLFIRLEGISSTPLTINLTDLSGKTLRSETYTDGTLHQLSLNGITPGVYLIQASSKGAVSTQKIIIQ